MHPPTFFPSPVSLHSPASASSSAHDPWPRRTWRALVVDGDVSGCPWLDRPRDTNEQSRAGRPWRCSWGAVVLVFFGGLLQGCATTKDTGMPSVAQATPHRRPPPSSAEKTVNPAPLAFVDDGAFAYVDGKTGASLSLQDVADRLRRHRVVVVGERHDQRAHHEAQGRVIELIGQGGPGVVVGLEMLTWDKQEPLERFNSGAIGVDELAEVVDWKKAWGFDFGLYAPVFSAGRKAGARFVALNVPRSVVRQVREGGIEALPPEDQRRMPELDLGDDRHRAWFSRIFSSAAHPLKPGELDGFYRAQVLWDEVMAEGAVRALRDGARQVVVLAGAGHVALGRGVPQRVERRLPGEAVFTLVPLTVTAEDALATVRQAIIDGEADVLVVPRFAPEVHL
jgi:uncharacterized iron-regulated protein